MPDESIRERAEKISVKVYKLLSLARKGKDITVRDDQYDFSSLLDSVKICRQRGFRFRLIDSGKLDQSQCEWLAEAGADFYTSDEARTAFSELELIARACRKSGAIVAYFHNGPFESDKDKSTFSFADIQDVGRCGIYVHCTNREHRRDISQLRELSFACRKGRSWLVYYHHGALEPGLEVLARDGTWVHVSDQGLQKPHSGIEILDHARALIIAGGHLVIHLKNGLELALLQDLRASGAFLLFPSFPFDYKSPFRTLEREARKRKPDYRAYYLYPTFLP